MEFWEILLLTIALYIAVMFVYSLIICIFVQAQTKKREDKNELLTYFTVEDYKDLSTEKFTFENKHHLTLAGTIYYNKKITFNRVIVFFHGFGPGHIAYTTLIKDLVMSNKLPVITFDYTGTGESEGKNLRNFFEPLNDAGALINYLKGKPEFLNTEFLLIGHSWGGFVATNLAKLHPHLAIKRVVSLNGVTDFPGLFRYASKGPFILPSLIRFFNYFAYQKIAYLTTKKSIKNTTIPHLFIHGEKDVDVPVGSFIAPLVTSSVNNAAIKFHLEKTKHHNAYLTLESEKNLLALKEDLKMLSKAKHNRPLKEKIEKIDYTKLVENDEFILELIKTFFH